MNSRFNSASVTAALAVAIEALAIFQLRGVLLHLVLADGADRAQPFAPRYVRPAPCRKWPPTAPVRPAPIERGLIRARSISNSKSPALTFRPSSKLTFTM